MLESDDFYNELEFKPFVLNVLSKYKDYYNLVIVSKGTPLNLEKKQTWLKEHMPFEYKFVGVNNWSHDKRDVDMSNGIQIDDSYSCLKTNADISLGR